LDRSGAKGPWKWWASVVDLQEAATVYLGELFRAEGPAEVGMVDVRDPVYLAYGVDVGLERGHHAVGRARVHDPREIQPVHVDGSAVEG
jgi:hypothetical protein